MKPFSSDKSNQFWVSGIFLVIANLIPLVGALFYGWNVLDIVAVYWAENLILGGFSVLRMMVAGGGPIFAAFFARITLTGLFLVHYGGFCIVHGVFVFSLLKDDRDISNPIEAFDLLTTGGLGWALLALGASHGFSFIWNFIIRGEFRRTAAPLEMIAPYPRVIVLHLAIVLGAFAAQTFGQQTWILAILVIGKIVIDFMLHTKSHRLELPSKEDETKSIALEAAQQFANRKGKRG